MNTRGTERVNEEGAVETKVETADHRSPAGQEEKPSTGKVSVVHLTRHDRHSGTGTGVLASAAAAVKNTIKSAKDAVMGSGKDRTT